MKEALRRQSQDRGRPQGTFALDCRFQILSVAVDHSYRQGTADAYSSMTSSNGYNRPTAVNSTPAYPGPHNTYGAQHGAGLSAYDRPSGINTMDDDADDGTLLSRRSSRDDAYRRYPSSDRADSESLYGSSPRTQPINIVPQRRPSTSSDASDNSFDGMYGFRSSVASQGSRGCKISISSGPQKRLTSSIVPGSPRGDFHSPNNVYGRR